MALENKLKYEEDAMSSKKGCNVLVDEELKQDFQKVLKELGIPMSTAFTMFMKQTVREQRIPFDVSMNGNSVVRK